MREDLWKHPIESLQGYRSDSYQSALGQLTRTRVRVRVSAISIVIIIRVRVRDRVRKRVMGWDRF
jgi:hypothetical protein